MRLSRTIFEILSLIFQKLKRSRDSDHTPFRDNLSSIGWDMHTKFEVSSLSHSTDILGGLKIENGSHEVTTWSHEVTTSKSEVSTITCKEEIKGNAKCKNSRFEPPFGGLRGITQGSSMARWKAHCRLPISDN